MGVSATAYLRLGIKVTDEDFWEVVGTTQACSNGHEAIDDSRFCPKDGKPFKRSEKIRPTAGFLGLAQRRKTEPDKLYQALIDMGQISPADAVINDQTSLDDKILCVELRSCSESYKRAGGPIDYEELMGAYTELRVLAESLGLDDRPVGLYCQLEWR